MKVYIGPYRNRWTSSIHYRYMNKKYGYDWPDYEQKGLTQKSPPAIEVVLEKLEDALQSIYNATINKILDKRKDQIINVKIHNYDTWSMDHTLAHIIVPMLKQLKETKHGSPFVDDGDVPEELKSTSAPPKENEYDIDGNHHKRWDWVLGEMIWAFEQKNMDWEDQYYGPYIKGKDGESFSGRFEWVDDEGRKAHQERMSNGFRLFGKYFEALWD